MGNTCSPDKPKAEEPVTDMDAKAAVEEVQNQEEAQPGEKFAAIINNYQADNERLKREVDELKKQMTERVETQENEVQESNKLMEELNQIKGLMASQDTQLVKSKLSAALHSRATTMLSAENAAKLLISGSLDKFGRGGRGGAKSKFVELQLHKGQHIVDGFQPGFIRLTYADSAQSASRSTAVVMKIKEANVPQRYEGRSFALVAMVENQEKELVFACANKADMDKWTSAVTNGMAEIKSEVDDMNSNFSLKLEFAGPKLGIRVEEKLVTEEEKGDDEAPVDLPPPAEDKDEAAAAETEKPEEAEKPAEGEADQGEPAAPAEDAAEKAAEKKEEPACTLVVTAISDEALKAKGLELQMTLTHLNEHCLEGKPYSEQLGLLTKTAKPFTITFVGPKFLKKATVSATAYPEILKQLIADEPNDTQLAFNGIIKGSSFEAQLKKSDDPKALIRELLGNQRQLTALLQSAQVNEAEL